MKFCINFFLAVFPLIIHSEELSPKLDYSVQDKYLQELHSIFPRLSSEEKSQDWGREYFIGLSFAKELDLYQAITAFKRASFFIPLNELQRKSEIEYQILNAYYLGKRYSDVIDSFENSSLASTDRNFIALYDMLIILYDSYLKCNNPERAQQILYMADKSFPKLSKKLALSGAIASADFSNIRKLATDPQIQEEILALETKVSPLKKGMILTSEDLQNFNPEDEKNLSILQDLSACSDAALEISRNYAKAKKSPAVAATLNALIPGSGYLYLGQAQSAFTSLAFNSLFIAASTHFFLKGNYAAGAITSTFELGWYLGGIFGASEGAKFYNVRLYEKQAHYRMRDHKLYPVLMLKHGF